MTGRLQNLVLVGEYHGGELRVHAELLENVSYVVPDGHKKSGVVRHLFQGSDTCLVTCSEGLRGTAERRTRVGETKPAERATPHMYRS